MSVLIPGNLPQADAAHIRLARERALAEDRGIMDLPALRSMCPVMVVAVRGYFRDTLGAVGMNDVGVFDDAAFLVAGDKVHRFNWNTDPSKTGWNTALGKPYAMLCPGIWPFLPGPHKGKGPAWRQPEEERAKAAGLGRFFSDGRAAGEFAVYRDRRGMPHEDSPVEKGYFAINIHWGGETGTSSWGCQTAPPVQWKEFLRLSYALAKGQPFLPYLLMDQDQFTKG